MSHDQLFKELLQAFFREFMELFYADIAARLDFSRVTFLDKETFTDLPQGDQREADIVAQVYTLDGQPEIILTHIEVEMRRRSTFAGRMHEYYMMLKLRHRLPIFPIVVYLSPGAGGLVQEQLEDAIFERQVNLFTFQAVGLPDLSADDYQESENPLGPALSALMKTSRLGKVAQAYHTLRMTALSRLDEARKSLLINVIETYIALNDKEQALLEQLVATPEGEEVEKMITVYEQRGIEKGIKQGLERGIEQGLERGIEQGILQGKRDSLLRLLHAKFGDLPERTLKHIEHTTDTDELDRLTDQVLIARTLEEMGFPEI